MSAISEANIFLPIKAWITKRRSVIKLKETKTLPVKWVFKRKGEPCVLINLKLINVVNGYMQFL